MSALLENLPRYRAMTIHDLDAVMAIEKVVYPHPWTRGNFSDSLHSGYHCWMMECGGESVGYIVAMIAAGEAHVLNLSIAAQWQRRGHGSALLEFLLGFARERGAGRVLLEVRLSNAAGRGLYAAAGFREIATRRGYYPDYNGREDAIVMELELK